MTGALALTDMTEFAEAISTDASAAPAPTRARNPLLGDPHIEGNEHLFDGTSLDDTAEPGEELPMRRRRESDDLHAPLNNSDVQN